MATALYAATDHLAFNDVEGGKERRRAVSLVVVRHRAGAPLLHHDLDGLVPGGDPAGNFAVRTLAA